MKTARVLELDPDLGLDMAEPELARARQALVARSYDLAPGAWEIAPGARESGAYGLLVVRGLLTLRTSIADRATLELVGPGDLLQPWVQLGSETSVPPTAGWEVLEGARILLLDHDFAAAAAGWPEVASALMYRLVLRSRRLCYQLAVNTAPQVEQRLLYSLWSLADRWGRVTEDGTLLELRLTHQQLAELVAAQRPSVSAALSRLRDERRIGYDRTSFILYGDVPGEVAELKDQLAL
jgi:CRP-like cAMP-binding protein